MVGRDNVICRRFRIPEPHICALALNAGILRRFLALMNKFMPTLPRKLDWPMVWQDGIFRGRLLCRRLCV